ncbi:hypothetical protein Ancab_038858 [Ancistrocladus abbreviatus]
MDGGGVVTVVTSGLGCCCRSNLLFCRGRRWGKIVIFTESLHVLIQDLLGHFSRGCFLNTTEDRIEEECDYMEFRNLPCATTVGMVLFLSICREGAPLALRDQVPPSSWISPILTSRNFWLR